VAVRINPSIDKWLAEAENDRLRGLERNLGRGMFGATAAERARIARDLHDHQAQPLAAARTRIEAGSANEGRLTLREREVLRLLSDGATSKDIAEKLGLSRKTPSRSYQEQARPALDVCCASKHWMVKSARKGLPRLGRRKSGKGSPFDLRSIPLRSG
jgi:hypothetical protein